MVDAEAFLGFAGRLRDLHARVDSARITDETRQRWQNRLAAIADAGRDDLDRAQDLLRRFEAELDRRGAR